MKPLELAPCGCTMNAEVLYQDRHGNGYVVVDGALYTCDLDWEEAGFPVTKEYAIIGDTPSDTPSVFELPTDELAPYMERFKAKCLADEADFRSAGVALLDKLRGAFAANGTSDEWKRDFLTWIDRGGTVLLRDICAAVGLSYWDSADNRHKIDALDTIAMRARSQ